MGTAEYLQVAPATHRMVLQLATERQVHAFDLTDTFRVALGRHHTNHVQLRSRRVSNYHAEILNEVDGLVLRDLGSTNGTYLNDENVRRQPLKSGDHIRIGSFEITVKIVPREADGADARFAVGTIGNVLPFRGPSPASSESRDRTDKALPDLLSELSRARATVTVRLHHSEQEGKIYIVEGAVVHAEVGAARREKALYRLLAFQKGSYEILEPSPAGVPHTISAPTESLLVEGIQQIEAMEKLAAKLPPVSYEIVLNERCSVPVNTLTSDELEVYRCLIRHGTLVRALEESAMTDFMVLLLTHGLLQKDFFHATSTAGPLLEDTAVSKLQPA
jgi:hypothetical protein